MPVSFKSGSWKSGDRCPGQLGRVGQVSPSLAREYFLTLPNKLQTCGLKETQRGSRSNRVITRFLDPCHKENLLDANIWMVLQQHIKGKAKDGERPVFTGNLTKGKLLPGHKTKQANKPVFLLCHKEGENPCRSHLKCSAAASCLEAFCTNSSNCLAHLLLLLAYNNNRLLKSAEHLLAG